MTLSIRAGRVRLLSSNDRAAWRRWARESGYAGTNGVILYEGPSLIDGAPIVVIATGLGDPSDNGKTDDMIQTWTLRLGVEPHVAAKCGADTSVCGSCPKRRSLHKRRKGVCSCGSTSPGCRCYVRVHEAPLSVYRAYYRGRYPRIDDVPAWAIPQGLGFRMGSYGDPGAVPAFVWTGALDAFVPSVHTGYSHRWADTGAGLRGLVMASVDTDEERLAARAAGFGTFQGVASVEQVVFRPQGTSPCPASKEMGARLSCEQCHKCDGREVSVVIALH